MAGINLMIILRKYKDDHWARILIDELGQVDQVKMYASLAMMPVVEKHQRLIVLLPGETVTMTRVKLPKTRRSELIKAVPFALEEQLAEDIQHLHFVLGDFDVDGNLLVAIINKQLFSDTLASLQQHDIHPNAIIPDFLALTQKENAWTIAVDKDTAMLRTDTTCGFAIEKEVFPKTLEFFLQDNKPPKNNCIVCSSS